MVMLVWCPGDENECSSYEILGYAKDVMALVAGGVMVSFKWMRKQ